MILVPYQYAGDHQRFNAAPYVERRSGAADPRRAVRLPSGSPPSWSALIDDPHAWRQMAASSAQLGRRDAAARVVDAAEPAGGGSGENPTMTGHVHFLGICGYAVSGAALVAREQGWRVSGSDDQAYPPTTDILTAAGIDWVDGSDPANLERWGIPDLVVVGNQTRADQPGVAGSAGPWAADVQRDRVLPAPDLRATPCRRVRNPRQDDDVRAARPHARCLRHGPRLQAGLDVAGPRRQRAPGHGPVRVRGRRVHHGARGTRVPSSSTSTRSPPA